MFFRTGKLWPAKLMSHYWAREMTEMQSPSRFPPSLEYTVCPHGFDKIVWKEGQRRPYQLGRPFLSASHEDHWEAQVSLAHPNSTTTFHRTMVNLEVVEFNVVIHKRSNCKLFFFVFN